MKSIIFVDDELKVLQGLQRMLRSMRHEWDMKFATSGQKALDMLSKSPFDVIVTDMRMTGMDGAQLLREVMKRYPGVVRIILSGQTDQDVFLSSSHLMHQFLEMWVRLGLLAMNLKTAWRKMNIKPSVC